MDLLVNNPKVKNQPRSGLFKSKLNSSEVISVVYHDIFDYPLTLAELITWRTGSKVSNIQYPVSSIKFKNGFYFLEGRGRTVYKRLLRKRISERKMEIAKKAARALSLLPPIKMIGVTGALAMKNSTDEGDIDLMIVTRKGLLWTTRLLGYLVTWLLGMEVRKPGDKDQKDKICLNLWLDETVLAWPKKDRNLYTAHEIAQVIPLINKDKTYERFIWENRWILNFWPSAVKIHDIRISRYKGIESKKQRFLNISISNRLISFLESLAFQLQYLYMRPKITREIVTPTRALFHPNDLRKVVLSKLNLG